jgi:hypothetical protein
MLLKAVEEKRFFPMGSDREVSSDFQLIAGTNRDLRVDVAQGRFREDLYARINLWSYTLPGLAQRPEDMEPNIEHLLARAAAETGRAVRFNAEAKALPALRAVGRGTLERQLPRPLGQRHATGHARRRRAHFSRSSRSRPKSSGCVGCGSTPPPARRSLIRRPSKAFSLPNRWRNWTSSTASSSKPS